MSIWRIPISGDKVKFVYIRTGGTLPATPDGNTIYFDENTKQIYVGSEVFGGGSASSVDWANIANKPDFAAVATSGNYLDLDNRPIIPEDTDFVDIQDTIDFLNSMGLDTETDLVTAVADECHVGAAILSE